MKDLVLIAFGWALGLVGTEIHNYFQRRRDARERAVEERRVYKGWLVGLRAELNDVQKVSAQVSQVVNGGYVPTKRISSDFLREARLAIFNHERDAALLEELTTAYRDIVHANLMFDRGEDHRTESRANPRVGPGPNLRSAMDDVLSSVKALSDSVNAKLRHLERG